MKWPLEQLCNLAQFRNGLNFTKSNFGQGLKVVNVKDFKDRFKARYDELEEIDPVGLVSDDDFLLDQDILFVRSNGNRELVGRSLLVEQPPEPVSFSAFAIRVRFNSPQVIPRFYAYFFRSPAFRQFLSLQGAGTNICNLNQKILRDLMVPFPAISTQLRVIELLSAYDDLMENNLRRIALLEEWARLLYREWFVRLRFPGHEHSRIVDGVPEGWELEKTREVCESIGGGTPSTSRPEYWESGDITWVTPTDITRNNCLVLLESEKKITESGLKNSSAKLLPPETILMTSRATLGYFGLMDREVCTNQGFISVIPHEERLRMYILHNLMSRREEIIGKAGGTTYKEINKSTFREMDIVIPSKALLDRFREFADDTVRQTRVLKKQAEKLKLARDLLLPRLMRGEIAV